MPKVSVIIPVYNVEPYLPRCLDSVTKQTLEDIEIICINDCSTDGSLAILQDYASKDKRIKIIDIGVNEGVSYARNTGIDEASGDYIAFLDPDDWWNLDLAKKAYDKIVEDNSDVVQFGHNRLTDNKLTQYKIVNQIKDVINGKDYKEYFCDFVNLVWDKIYKTSFIKDKNIKFPLNIHQTEDVLFVLECFSYQPKLSFIPESLCNYRIDREDSAMKKYEKLVNNQIDAANIMFNCDFYKNADNNYKKLCIKKIVSGIFYFCLITMGKKYSMKNYLPKMQEFIKYLKEELPAELVSDSTEIKTLVQFIAIRQNIKNKKDIS